MFWYLFLRGSNISLAKIPLQTCNLGWLGWTIDVSIFLLTISATLYKSFSPIVTQSGWQWICHFWFWPWIKTSNDRKEANAPFCDLLLNVYFMLPSIMLIFIIIYVSSDYHFRKRKKSYCLEIVSFSSTLTSIVSWIWSNWPVSIRFKAKMAEKLWGIPLSPSFFPTSIKWYQIPNHIIPLVKREVCVPPTMWYYTQQMIFHDTMVFTLVAHFPDLSLNISVAFITLSDLAYCIIPLILGKYLYIFLIWFIGLL